MTSHEERVINSSEINARPTKHRIARSCRMVDVVHPSTPHLSWKLRMDNGTLSLCHFLGKKK